MTPDQLETLLTDRAFNALAPEVSALLEHHVAQDFSAARRAAEIEATLQLARTVVATPRETPRPLDVARLRAENRPAKSAIRRGELLRLAACLALGLTLGALVRPARRLTAPAPVLVAATSLRPVEPPTHFWSVAHFAPEAAQLQPRKKP